MTDYIDTSALAAFYSPEPLSDAAEALLRHIPQPAISWLTEVELHSAVARKVRLHELTESDGRVILQAFQDHVETGYYHRLPLARRHYEVARDRISTFAVPLRSLDALHLGIALEEGMTLVTADTALGSAMAHFGGTVRLLERKSP